jgi:hypothetical protein
MRRAITSLAVTALGAIALALPGVAAATPTVSFKAKAVPISGYAHTGNIYGAGAAIEAEYAISGTEYGGFPPPLIGVNVYLPAGTVLHPSGFPTCKPSTLEPSGKGPKGCPKGSAAGPRGSVTGYVAFGKTVVPENATIESFYAPGGGLTFFTFGHEPVLLEIPTSGRLVHTDNQGGFGPEFSGKVPLVETVPGALDASVESIDITLGTAIRRHHKTIYYGTVPHHCPHGGFRAKTEFVFAENGLEATPVTVTVPVRAPCPTS